MDMKLELVPVPVSDVSRALDFYVNKAGFKLDHDVQLGENVRIVQLTPPGSACSILLSQGLPDLSGTTPGSIRGLHLVVQDITQIRETLIQHGVEIGKILVTGGIKYAGFGDPDGNTWTLQEIPANL